MKEQYRRDYVGEYVITNIRVINGKKEQNRVWINNPLAVNSVSNRATCIAESSSLKGSFYKQIQNHNGGNLGEFKMQLYGVDSVWQKMVPNFTVCKDRDMLEKMIQTQFTKESVVYTSASNCTRYPGEFYLTPYHNAMNPHALAVWLACFDGHKEIYIVGYDHTNYKIMATVQDVMQVYKDVKFIQVTNNGSPHEWKQQLNFSAMTKDQFVSHCDV